MRPPTHTKCPSKRLIMACAVLLPAWQSGMAHAGPCADAERLCRGNLCVVHRVDSPCRLDFGTRDVKISRTLHVPDGGVLSIKGGSISSVRASIVGKGATVTLSAAGAMQLGPIDVSAARDGGTIDLTAGTSVILLSFLHASGLGTPGGRHGGEITIDAGVDVSGGPEADLDTRGSFAPAGPISISAGNAVSLYSARGIRATGTSGGNVAITASSGDILIHGYIDASGSIAAGGHVTLSAVGGRLTEFRALDVSGGATGGLVEIGAASVEFLPRIDASGVDGGAVTIDVAAGQLDGPAIRRIDVSGDDRQGTGGAVTLNAPLIPSLPDIVATGHTGGAITARATGGVISGVSINVSGSSSRGIGGTVCLAAPSLSLNTIEANGGDHGGTILLAATAGNLNLGTGQYEANGARSRRHTGGVFQATASGDIHLGYSRINVLQDGCIGLDAGGHVPLPERRRFLPGIR